MYMHVSVRLSVHLSISKAHCSLKYCFHDPMYVYIQPSIVANMCMDLKTLHSEMCP